MQSKDTAWKIYFFKNQSLQGDSQWNKSLQTTGHWKQIWNLKTNPFFFFSVPGCGNHHTTNSQRYQYMMITTCSFSEASNTCFSIPFDSNIIPTCILGYFKYHLDRKLLHSSNCDHRTWELLVKETGKNLECSHASGSGNNQTASALLSLE